MITALLLGVLAMNAFALALVLLRAPLFRTRLYRPMVLNLGLSLAPLLVIAVGLLGATLLLAVSRAAAVVTAVVVLVVWLLLLPNASYLITELNLSHRREDDPVPLWYDIVLVISLAMSGVFNAVLSVFVVQFEYVLLRYGDEAAPLTHGDSALLVAVVLLLAALGMYLGRYLRLNSWDVRHPASLVRKLAAHLRAGNLRAMVGYTTLYAIFLGVMYLVLVGPAIAGLVLLEQARA